MNVWRGLARRQQVVFATAAALALLAAVIGFAASGGEHATTSLSSGGTTTSTSADGAASGTENTTTTTTTSTTLVPSTTVTTVKVGVPTTTTPPPALRGFGADGWLVYDISGEEHLVAPDGSGDYILNTAITEPAWSEDHTTLVFAAHAQRPGMHFVRSDGVLHKYSNDEGHHRWPTVAADGAHVLAASFTYGATPPWTIHVISLDGSDDHVVHSQTEQIDQVAASPDGTTIAFISNEQQIVLMNPDGTNVRAAPNGAGAWWLDWTKDSQSVVFTSQGDIWKLNVHTGERTQITKTANAEANPQVSPDGTMLAVSVDAPERGVDVMKLDGSQRLHIVTAPVYEIAW